MLISIFTLCACIITTIGPIVLYNKTWCTKRTRLHWRVARSLNNCASNSSIVPIWLIVIVHCTGVRSVGNMKTPDKQYLYIIYVIEAHLALPISEQTSNVSLLLLLLFLVYISLYSCSLIHIREPFWTDLNDFTGNFFYIIYIYYVHNIIINYASPISSLLIRNKNDSCNKKKKKQQLKC